jgi:hypothetical protein
MLNHYDYFFMFPLKVDSFKRSSEIKSCPQFEVDFLPSYAQNERNLSEFYVPKIVRGVGFEPTIF